MQHLDSLCQWIDAGLLIELQTYLLKELLNLCEAVLQIFFALVNQGEVVHISDVVFDVQTLFDEVIHVVEHSQLHKLADLASEPNSDITAKAVDHVAGVVRRALILHALSHGGLCHVMPGGVCRTSIPIRPFRVRAGICACVA